MVKQNGSAVNSIVVTLCGDNIIPTTSLTDLGCYGRVTPILFHSTSWNLLNSLEEPVSQFILSP